jgi:hypothetical protein
MKREKFWEQHSDDEHQVKKGPLPDSRLFAVNSPDLSSPSPSAAQWPFTLPTAAVGFLNASSLPDP